MKISDNHHVSLHYTLTLDSGEVVDRSEPDEPLALIVGMGQTIPGFEKGLEGLEAGQAHRFTLSAEDGYGERSDDLLIDIPRSRFPDDVEVKPGMKFHGPGGRMFTVSAVKGDAITVDANHPLAGERLTFDVKVETVREATEEELQEAMAGCGSCCGCEGHDGGHEGHGHGCGEGHGHGCGEGHGSHGCC